jgi:hypothetical protein
MLQDRSNPEAKTRHLLANFMTRRRRENLLAYKNEKVYLLYSLQEHNIREENVQVS